jgi:predicted alpha/beta hydrolase family esterase
MKIHAHWRRHVEAWRESGLSQVGYCRQQGPNRKTFSVWTRRVQGDLSLNKDDPVEFISVQVAPSVPVATTGTSAILVRFPQGAQLELSTAVPPLWLAELLRCLI